MSAEVLREAAALMRTRAAFADAGPYSRHPLDCQCCVQIRSVKGHQLADNVDCINAEHVASWHPAVALAVADLLDNQAKFSETMPGFDIEGLGDASALAVANAYLGRDA